MTIAIVPRLDRLPHWHQWPFRAELGGGPRPPPPPPRGGVGPDDAYRRSWAGLSPHGRGLLGRRGVRVLRDGFPG